jgi:hypothetical protein
MTATILPFRPVSTPQPRPIILHMCEANPRQYQPVRAGERCRWCRQTVRMPRSQPDAG